MSSLTKGRPTVCAIDLAALRWNFRQIRKKVGPGVKVLAMVKGNGYGHGATEVARTLAKAGCDAFGVATLEEGVELRRAGIKPSVLVFAGLYPDQLGDLARFRLTPTLGDLGVLNRFERLARRRKISLPFHLKLDTGMGRLGLADSEVESWLPELRKLKALKLEGLFSHFSNADSVERDYTRRQLETFKQLIRRLQGDGYDPPLVHLANSAAVITLPAAYFSMVRPGLMLYGVHPSPEMAGQIELKPVLSWKTRILQLKEVPPGTSVSYGQTFVTKRESRIAALPVGYADGYHRLLSNRGAVLVRGQRAPIAGRVCMDLTMVDVTDIGGVKQGDEVVLLGRQGGEKISADEIAGWAETISYEIFTSIGARVPRVQQGS